MHRVLDRWAAVLFSAWLGFGFALLTVPIGARETAPAPEKTSTDSGETALGKVLTPLIERHRGRVGIAVKHLKSGESFEHQADEVMPTASLIKFPIMIAAYQAVADEKLSLDRMLELRDEDKVPGSGILTSHFSPGTRISLRDAIHLMIVYSDNTATNLVIDELGLARTSEHMESLGLNDTRLHAKVYRGDTSIAPDRSRKYGLGSTSATEMMTLLERLHHGELVSRNASEAMLEHLHACEDKLKSPRLLPKGTRVAHKTGSVNSSRTDAGIIYSPSGPIAFAILTTDNEDEGWTNDNEGDLLCSHIALAAYRHFNGGREGAAPVARVLRIGDDGDHVSALQRTINARLKPSPEMTIDGDFGPETERGVKRFQEQAGLEPTGIVDSATWQALGPLLLDDEPTPEPSVINSAGVAKEPMDPLEGPPFVTAKAWAIVDAKSGDLLAGDNEDTRRDPASTTKMMTAYLVTSLAEANPEILNEIVTFSERADRTPGSTSGLRAGEQIRVGELLFGLMLPSGNDAAVALAEHFGDRFSDEQESEQSEAAGAGAAEDSYDRFVQAMNRKAGELGMESTQFKNPHGLPAEGHHTTARDLALLAMAALEQPEFAKRVSTFQHGATVGSVSGYKRNVVWKNTNQLLRRDGYDGVKTGTTGPAGCCLVSRGEREGRKLIAVVLGATSTESRYADTRNLYRWAWRDLVGIGTGANPTDQVNRQDGNVSEK